MWLIARSAVGHIGVTVAVTQHISLVGGSNNDSNDEPQYSVSGSTNSSHIPPENRISGNSSSHSPPEVANWSNPWKKKENYSFPPCQEEHVVLTNLVKIIKFWMKFSMGIYQMFKKFSSVEEKTVIFTICFVIR